MAKKRGARKSKSINVLGSLVGIASVAAAVKPVLDTGIIGHATAGNFQAVANDLVIGAQRAATPGNLAKAAAPAIGFGVAKLGARILGVRGPSVKLGGRTYRAF